MRYINLRFTYLLTYLLTYLVPTRPRHHDVPPSLLSVVRGGRSQAGVDLSASLTHSALNLRLRGTLANRQHCVRSLSIAGGLIDIE